MQKNKAIYEVYLSFLASRIVFLIDWNRARKHLGKFVRKEDVFSILKWSADNELGRYGFSEMGGEQLIFGAIKRTAKSPLHFGHNSSRSLAEKKRSNS